MNFPTFSSAFTGVRDRLRSRRPDRPARARGAGAGWRRSVRALPEEGIPMPLGLQGAIELLAVAVVGLLLTTAVLGAVWVAGGFETMGISGSVKLAGQLWLLAHCTPVTIDAVRGLNLPGSGTVTLFPLGLTLVPFGLAVLAGRRIARACWRGQFLVPFATGMFTYAVVGLVTALLSATEQVSVNPVAAALFPLIPAGLGTLLGGWSESRSLAAVLGTDAASWLHRTSQYSRWAGSYVWAVVRAGFVAAVATVAGGALLVAVVLAWNWDGVIAVYQRLGTGMAGDLALTALQFGYLPNLVVWAVAWASGAGFAVGTGTVTSPWETTLGPVPQFPMFAALPEEVSQFAPAVLVLPLVAGILAGWWFCREGENHLDDWMAIRLPLRWITFVISTVLTVVFIAAVGAGLVAFVVTLSNGSLGIGRLTHMGPSAWHVFLWLGADLAVGAAIGYVVGPWLEREGYSDQRAVDTPPSVPVTAGDGSGPGTRQEGRGGSTAVRRSRFLRAARPHGDGAVAAGDDHSTDVAEGPDTFPATGDPAPASAVTSGAGTPRIYRSGEVRDQAGHGDVAAPRAEPQDAEPSARQLRKRAKQQQREQARLAKARRTSEKRKAARIAALDRQEPEED